ncbi:Tat pathway signal protein [Campylobacter sp. TTU-622]|uniref:Tat pathway signal protein n=1 Tax=unclassified Campylobacter TaxID=2593542 RepID=UPI0019068179|nr:MULTISPECIES: Tat pathway signal protein [unclassified Campylobacter]MBK1972209.1 Tat pathway signal protein [Campylobacter sp. TTU_617]MBK1972924.1 Tat pathway signal protein [Campylobacter sp. TTU-622]MBK1991892.1 Tat pathway signal protein [Campylobacter sp. 2018MI34]
MNGNSSRRNFLRKSLKVGATALVVSSVAKAATQTELLDKEKNVIFGKSNKNEVLYQETAHWEAYYKAAY